MSSTTSPKPARLRKSLLDSPPVEAGIPSITEFHDSESAEKKGPSPRLKSRRSAYIIIAVVLGGFFLAQTAILIYLLRGQNKLEHPQLIRQKEQIQTLSTQLRKAQESILILSRQKRDPERNSKSLHKDDVSISVWPTLPSSSIYCRGKTVEERICRFRNLCYFPNEDNWYVLNTSTSVFENFPSADMEDWSDVLLQSGSVMEHTWFNFAVAVDNPFSDHLANLTVRYEEKLHFITKRFHPKNIMHNLHDDIFSLYHLIKSTIGGGLHHYGMPFNLDGHKIQLIDPYGPTETTRPLQYLSAHSLKFKNYLTSNDKIVTCYRDAVIGNSRLATFYQYGFKRPQGKIANKSVNGMHIREISEWYLRRMKLPLGMDEIEGFRGNAVVTNSTLDFIETDLVLILVRHMNRKILNQDTLARRIHAKFGFEVMLVSNEEHSFEEQVALMRRARIVMAMHGSILIMTMFCRRGTVVLELFPYGVPGDHYTPYKTLAQSPGMNIVYRKWENNHPENTVGFPERHHGWGGINHLPQEEQQKILSARYVPQHVCCENSYWLYRIYQDTIVHEEEVLDILENALAESRSKLTEIRSRNWHLAEKAVSWPLVRWLKCVDDERRPLDSLWLVWGTTTNPEIEETPGAHPDLSWAVSFDGDSHAEFITPGENPSGLFGGFQPGSKLTIRVRGRVVSESGNATHGPWSRPFECYVGPKPRN